MKSHSAASRPRRTLVRGGRVLNVFTGELLDQDIVIENERIVAVIPREVGTATDRVPQVAGSGPVGSGAAAASGSGRGSDIPFDEIIDATDRIVVPGYVEPHAHIGLMAEPITTLEQMARTGTTALVVDTYALMVTLTDDDLERVFDHMQTVPTYVRWFLAPHARSFLVDEEEQFAVERLERWLAREDVAAIGELTRWPTVVQGEPDIVDKIQRALRAGKRVEGHGAGASPPRLQRLAWHGVTSDHEGITPEQVLDRVRLGFYTMLRHSSLRPDLPHLLEAIRGELQHSNRIMLTVDGPTPVWMDEHGYLDNLIRICIEGGISPAAAYRMATLNPAMYYRIEHDVGAIAAGRRADLNVLNELTDPTPTLVMARGRVVAKDGEIVESYPRIAWEELAGMNRPPGRAPTAELFAFGAGADGSARAGDEAASAAAPDSAASGARSSSVSESGSAGSPGIAARDGTTAEGGTAVAKSGSAAGGAAWIPTLDVAHTVLLRLAEPAPPTAENTDSGSAAATAEPGPTTAADRAPAPLRVAVYDWNGRWMTRAFVKGYVDRLGGLATSYSPAYQVTVFGHNPEDMAMATARVMDARGGLCLVEEGQVVFEMSLERAGFFNELPWPELVARLAEFGSLMRERGYVGHELLYSMFFFGFDSLPDYRLTVRGVWDVRRQQVLAPPLQLAREGDR